MIRLFASDLDGTLLNRFHMSDDYILKTIDAIIEDHKYFVVATGRNMYFSQQQELFHGRPIYYICMNGARIIDHDQKILFEQPLDPKIVRALLETFPDIPFECVGETETYTRLHRYQQIKKMNSGPIYKRIAKIPILLRMLKDWQFDQSNDDICQKRILKINCHIKESPSSKQLSQFIDQHADQIINAPFASGIFEITDHRVNKGNAIHHLAQYLDVKDEEIAVYGDGGNDVKMLEAFEHSYAPYHSSALAKKAANHILEDQGEHSVAKHMRFLLKK